MFRLHYGHSVLTTLLPTVCITSQIRIIMKWVPSQMREEAELEAQALARPLLGLENREITQDKILGLGGGAPNN